MVGIMRNTKEIENGEWGIEDSNRNNTYRTPKEECNIENREFKYIQPAQLLNEQTMDGESHWIQMPGVPLWIWPLLHTLDPPPQVKEPLTILSPGITLSLPWPLRLVHAPTPASRVPTCSNLVCTTSTLVPAAIIKVPFVSPGPNLLMWIILTSDLTVLIPSDSTLAMVPQWHCLAHQKGESTLAWSWSPFLVVAPLQSYLRPPVQTRTPGGPDVCSSWSSLPLRHVVRGSVVSKITSTGCSPGISMTWLLTSCHVLTRMKDLGSTWSPVKSNSMSSMSATEETCTAAISISSSYDSPPSPAPSLIRETKPGAPGSSLSPPWLAWSKRESPALLTMVFYFPPQIRCLQPGMVSKTKSFSLETPPPPYTSIMGRMTSRGRARTPTRSPSSPST